MIEMGVRDCLQTLPVGNFERSVLPEWKTEGDVCYTLMALYVHYCVSLCIRDG